MTVSTVDAGKQAALSRKLDQLRRTYLKRMGATIAGLRRVEALLESGFFPPGDAQSLYRLSHDYAGSGATFGFPEVSGNARALHLSLREFLDSDQAAPGARAVVLEKLRVFEAACRAAIDTPPPAPADEPETASTGQKLVGVFDNGSEAEGFAEQLRNYGYRVEIFGDTPALWPAERPQAFVAFGALPPAAAQIGTNAPLVVAAGDNKFESRLAAVRAGAAAYLTGPIDTLKIIEKVETLSIDPDTARYAILIADDDQQLSDYFEYALRQAGMQTIAVSNARDALKAMTVQSFDLILMDYVMPGCDGQELATIIRQDEVFTSLPIVFMSAKKDVENLLIDRGLGIDAYLVKPFSPEQLVSVVRSRARRGAELRSLMRRDTFTGLLNHATFIEAMEAEHHVVRRTGRTTAYAIIDIDKFKSINDTFGHAAGDRVIKDLARLLKYQLRRSDVVGRCGGEEFGIIMPDCSLENAERIVGNLLQKFRELEFEFDGKTKQVTFSGGVVALDPEKPVDALMATADKALYQAKEAGRNLIMVTAAE